MATLTSKPNLGLTEQAANGIVDLLNRVLSDEWLIYTKARNYHWNVVGKEFHSLHEMFEQQYTDLEKVIDETAELVRQYGGRAYGTLAEFQQCTRLSEQPGELPNADGMIGNLLDDHEAIVRHLREDIEAAEKMESADVADFLTGLLEQHLKMAWMLRALLER